MKVSLSDAEAWGYVYYLFTSYLSWICMAWQWLGSLELTMRWYF